MLFLICHSAPALSVAIWVYSFINAAKIPARQLGSVYGFVDACPSRFCCGDFVGLRVVDSSSNRLRSIFFVCNAIPICECPFFPVRGLEF